MTALTGKKILVTGLTGSVGFPVAKGLAADNEVWGAARFSSARRRLRIEAAGITCASVDLVAADFSELPDDFDYVLNFAVSHTQDIDEAMSANAEAAGLLMAHCRKATAVLHCSSTGVYQPDGHHRFAEADPLGDNHRAYGLTTYSITKIAAEAVVRQAARLWNLPTTIARLNVPYGDRWGLPWMHLEMMASGAGVDLHPDGPVLYNPIHEDDLVAMVPDLLRVASVPATIVNWAGTETVSVEDWCAYLGELTGLTARFTRTPASIGSVAVDTTRMEDLVGRPTVGWREGFRRMAAARPEPTTSGP